MNKTAMGGGTPKKRAATSWRATWNAISRLPTEHFPLLLPGVHPLAAFFILRRLKHLGYSSCKVQTTSTGLIVHAHR